VAVDAGFGQRLTPLHRAQRLLVTTTFDVITHRHLCNSNKRLYTLTELQHFLTQKRNMLTDVPPFLTPQSHERLTLLRVAAVENFRLYFSLLGYSLNTRPLLMI
jgi:hypothetical protein